MDLKLNLLSFLMFQVICSDFSDFKMIWYLLLTTVVAWKLYASLKGRKLKKLAKEIGIIDKPMKPIVGHAYLIMTSRAGKEIDVRSSIVLTPKFVCNLTGLSWVSSRL